MASNRRRALYRCRHAFQPLARRKRTIRRCRSGFRAVRPAAIDSRRTAERRQFIQIAGRKAGKGRFAALEFEHARPPHQQYHAVLDDHVEAAARTRSCLYRTLRARFSLALRRALPPRFRQAYAGRNRHVQALHVPEHRNSHQQVTVFTREPPQALSFRTQYPGEWPTELGTV